jgi:hypothetical protein
MIHMATYGDRLYERSKARLCAQARDSGWFATISAYGPDDLEPSFRERHKAILSSPRGGGYWIWKPHIVRRRLQEIADNDILIYLDAGCTINRQGGNRLGDYIRLVSDNDEGIISFQTGHAERTWSTREIFEHFNVKTEEKITGTGQVMATVLIIRKCPRALRLVETWNETLDAAPSLFTDQHNANQDSCFKDNRHDQSVFSVIRKAGDPILVDDETWSWSFGGRISLRYPFWATRIK